MSKYTPGPLEVYEGPEDKPELTVQHMDKSCQVVTVADFLQREIPPKQRKANAVLFTAASDMLEAIDKAIGNAYQDEHGDWIVSREHLLLLNAAIAKAKRETE